MEPVDWSKLSIVVSELIRYDDIVIIQSANYSATCTSCQPIQPSLCIRYRVGALEQGII